MKRQRFCNIISCVNANGTKSLDYKFFRIPSKGKIRDEWISNINQHQEFHQIFTYFQVCNLHFTSDSFDHKKKLIKEAIPTIFSSKIQNNNFNQNSQDYQSTNSNSPTQVLLNKSESNDNVMIEYLVEDGPISADGATNDYQMGITTGLSSKFINNEHPIVDETRFESNDDYILVDGINNTHHTDSTDLSNVISAASNASSERFSMHQKRIFNLEIELYKAKDRIAKLEAKLDEKNKTILRLNTSVNYYKKEKEKREKEAKENISAYSKLSSDAKTVLECLTYGKNSLKYNEAVRKFAITAHFNSPSCYKFIRRKFNLHLPEISTIRKWYQKCTEKGEPGISKDGLDALSKLQQSYDEKGEQIYVSIAMDEIFIRKHIQWNDSRKRFMGFISHGIRDEHENDLPAARHALVYLVSGINIDFHLPIASYFVKSLNSIELADLVNQVICAVSSTNVKVVSLTFDGLSANFTACQHLGACFQMSKLKPYINNPVDNSKIYIIPDACHMIKLVRNFLASEKEFHNGAGEKIEWKFFEQLESYRESKNFVAHKLTKRHIQWERAKMDVKLAVQVLSNSVAESFLYLSAHGCQEFLNCEATAEFVKKMNDLFDILNTKRKKSEQAFKNAITKENQIEIFKFMEDMAEYIKHLTLNGVNVLDTRKRTGFKGLLISMLNIQNIYNDFIENDKFDSLPTFNLSQDPLESLFSRVRYLNGNNDNPTVEQFMSSIRKLMVQSEFTASQNANCRDALNILHVPSTSYKPLLDKSNDLNSKHYDVSEKEKEAVERIQRFSPNDVILDASAEATITFNAGMIEQKVQLVGRFNCKECKQVFSVNEKFSDCCIKSAKMSTPCVSTVLVCKIADKYMREFKTGIAHFNYHLIYQRIFDDVDFEVIYEKSFKRCDQSHKQYFVKFIIEEYIRMAATYMAKEFTLNQSKLFLRKELKKTIHKYGQ